MGKKHMYPPPTHKFTKIKFNKITKYLIILILSCTILIIYYLNSKKALKNPQYINLKVLLGICIHASQRGGQIVKEIREQNLLNSTSKGKTKEGANDPLTKGDIFSHLEMYSYIKNAFPNIKVISEEHTTKIAFKNRPEKESNLNLATIPDEMVNINDITVWIDPLDATQEYTENLRQYVTTMVCVAVKGLPVIGVINKPFEDMHKNTYWAWVNKGLSSNLQRQRINKEPVIIISRSHSGETQEKINELFGNKYKIISAGGAGYKILELVNGNADVYIHTTLIKKWDICPGNAILNALNGNLTTLSKTHINYSHEYDHVIKDGLLAYAPPV